MSKSTIEHIEELRQRIRIHLNAPRDIFEINAAFDEINEQIKFEEEFVRDERGEFVEKIKEIADAYELDGLDLIEISEGFHVRPVDVSAVVVINDPEEYRVGFGVVKAATTTIQLTVNSLNFQVWSKSGRSDKVFTEARLIAARFRDVVNAGKGFVLKDSPNVAKDLNRKK